MRRCRSWPERKFSSFSRHWVIFHLVTALRRMRRSPLGRARLRTHSAARGGVWVLDPRPWDQKEEKAQSAADDFFKALQVPLRDWLADGTTKTALIYGDEEKSS